MSDVERLTAAEARQLAADRKAAMKPKQEHVDALVRHACRKVRTAVQAGESHVCNPFAGLRCGASKEEFDAAVHVLTKELGFMVMGVTPITITWEQ